LWHQLFPNRRRPAAVAGRSSLRRQKRRVHFFEKNDDNSIALGRFIS
jgi:hypothetical protein